MVWWQGLLIVIGSVGLGILAGNIVARIIPLIFSQKRQTNFSNDSPFNHINFDKNTNSNHPQDFPNTKSTGVKEEQTWNLPMEMTTPVKGPDESLRTEDLTRKIFEPPAWNGIGLETKLPEKQAFVALRPHVKDDISEKNGPLHSKRVNLENPAQTLTQSQKRTTEIRELKSEPKTMAQTPGEKVQSPPKQKEKLMPKESKKPTRQRVNISPADPSRQTIELTESMRKLKETKEKLLGEIDLLNKEETPQLSREVAVQAAKKEDAVPLKNKEKVAINLNKHSLSLGELETNLRIATTPWDGKPLAFQTVIWDIRKSELNDLSSEQLDGLEQAYIDMGMANHIVWLWAEIGLKSKDLENSYRLLCSKISEQLQAILPEKTLTR